MNKIVGAGAAALMTVTVLAGCGGGGDSGGSGGGYCDDLKATKTTVTALGDNDMNQATFDKLSGDVRTIADEAPSDIKGDWSTIANALDTFNQAMSDAGITFDNLKDLGKAGAPSIDPAKLQAIEAAAGKLDADAITTASDNINQEVKSECNIDLNIGG
jgi:hypothetical protein